MKHLLAGPAATKIAKKVGAWQAIADALEAGGHGVLADGSGKWLFLFADDLLVAIEPDNPVEMAGIIALAASAIEGPFKAGFVAPVWATEH